MHNLPNSWDASHPWCHSQFHGCDLLAAFKFRSKLRNYFLDFTYFLDPNGAAGAPEKSGVGAKLKKLFGNKRIAWPMYDSMNRTILDFKSSKQITPRADIDRDVAIRYLQDLSLKYPYEQPDRLEHPVMEL